MAGSASRGFSVRRRAKNGRGCPEDSGGGDLRSGVGPGRADAAEEAVRARERRSSPVEYEEGEGAIDLSASFL